MDFLPAVFGCQTTKLTKKEKELFSHHKPFGLIIFSRNIETKEQLIELIKEFGECVYPNKPYIFIDEESGKIGRMNWLKGKTTSMEDIGKLYEKNKEEGLKELRKSLGLITAELNDCNINVDCVPVLDVYVPDVTNDFLKSRCIASNIDTVVALGNELLKIMKEKNILTIGKHIPGHGRAKSDSHKELPVVSESKDILIKEAATFQQVKTDFYMTSHVVYENIDKDNPGSLSKLVIKDFLREELNINAPIISDAIEMGALKEFGDIEQIAANTLRSGTDIVLHCSGINDDIEKICNKISSMDYTIRAELKPYLQTLPCLSTPTIINYSTCDDQVSKPIISCNNKEMIFNLENGETKLDFRLTNL